MKAPLPDDEATRLEALRSYGILDTRPEEVFDDLTQLAAHICGTPIALMSLVDERRQWFKARVGLGVRVTPRDVAFCARAILNPEEVLVVPDALADPRFAHNPLVHSEPHIRFYAGAPLVNRDGAALGTLCVIDRVPRELSPGALAALRTLARAVVNELDQRRSRDLREGEVLRSAFALARQSRLAAFVADIGTALAADAPLDFVLQRCAEAAVRHLEPAFARIWVLDPESQVLVLKASAGQYRHLDGPHSRIPVGRLKIGLIAEERKPHLTNEVIDDPRISDREWAKREGMVAFAGYPLLVGEEVEGVLAMFAKRTLDEAVLDTLSAVASGIAVRIHRTRLDADRERALAEERAARLEAETARGRLAGFLESVGDGFVALDKEGRCAFVSRRAAEILGRPAESLIGKTLWTELPEAVGRPLQQACLRAVAEQSPVQSEGPRASGSRWFETRIHPAPEGLLLFFQETPARRGG